MASKGITKILAVLFATIFLSGILLTFIQNVYVFLVSLIIIIGIIIGMIFGLDKIRGSESITAPETRKKPNNNLDTIFTKEQELTGARTKKKVKVLLCPTCGGRELYYEAGLITGYKYHCKDCDYIGAFVIEKDFWV